MLGVTISNIKCVLISHWFDCIYAGITVYGINIDDLVCKEYLTREKLNHLKLFAFTLAIPVSKKTIECE